MGFEEGDEIVEGEGGGLRTVEWIGIEVKDGFSGGGRGGGNDGFREASADHDEVKIRGLDGWVRRSFVHRLDDNR